MPSSESPSVPPSVDAVEQELARILASAQFINSGRLSAFLEYTVRKTIGAQSEEIKEYSVGIEVFDRPESFDPRLDHSACSGN
jgi:hypothetical protein